MVFVSWENGKNTIIWDTFSHPDLLFQVFEVTVVRNKSVFYFQLNIDQQVPV